VLNVLHDFKGYIKVGGVISSCWGCGREAGEAYCEV